MQWNRPFGNTGLSVSALGFGAGQLGRDDLSERDAEVLINQALDLGITLIDTARGYGSSEERIGKFTSSRRHEFTLSTKVGYGIEGFQDWTPEIIRAGVDRALTVLQTDVIDIVHLHSCPLHTLKSSGVVEALLREQDKGKCRVAAYSGENQEIAWAVQSGCFGSIQTSVNVTDQWSLRHCIERAHVQRMGVIGKRALANAPWRFNDRPVGDYAEEYWQRWKSMGINPGGLDWDELFLRYSAYSPGVSSAIVGTANADHLKANVEMARKGPLPTELHEVISNCYSKAGASWQGQV